MTNPVVLLTDGPSEGPALLLLQEIGRVLNESSAQGPSILPVEQNLSMALGLADRVCVRSKGYVAFEGAPSELLDDTEILSRCPGV